MTLEEPEIRQWICNILYTTHPSFDAITGEVM